MLVPKKRKSVTASTFSPCICDEVMGSQCVVLINWMFVEVRGLLRVVASLVGRRVWGGPASGVAAYGLSSCGFRT